MPEIPYFEQRNSNQMPPRFSYFNHNNNNNNNNINVHSSYIANPKVHNSSNLTFPGLFHYNHFFSRIASPPGHSQAITCYQRFTFKNVKFFRTFSQLPGFSYNNKYNNNNNKNNNNYNIPYLMNTKVNISSNLKFHISNKQEFLSKTFSAGQHCPKFLL